MEQIISKLNQKAVAHYGKNFLREVEDRVEDGEWVKMCMQCGVCAGSCPLGAHWEHSPQKIFRMIMAGKRDEVLTSDSVWMCTSCYNCIVRCPRKLPITHIMHGLGHYAHRLRPAHSRTRQTVLEQFGQDRAGQRTQVLAGGIFQGLKDGFVQGIKNALGMQGVALGLLKAKRLNPMEMLGGHKCKDLDGIKKMLAKAKEIEDRR